MKYLLVSCILLLSFKNYGQEIQRSIFSNGGVSNEDANVILSSTIGEPVDKIFFKDDAILKQGFEQPLKNAVITSLVINEQAIQISVFPIPTYDVLNIQLEANLANLTFRLFDINGKLVMADRIENQQSVLSLNELAAGMYLLQINASDNSSFQSIKVQKIN